MKVERATTATPELVEALGRLVPQLSPDAPAPTAEAIADMLTRDGTYLLVASSENGAIVGTLTLVVYRTPIRIESTIQVVVVDESARGQGVGEALTREAMRLAVEAGAASMRLTSRPHRQAAHRLYERLGFEQRQTNVYVWRAG